MTRDEIINGLKFTVEMFLFDPSTGETYTEPRNDVDKITIDACKGAIELLEQNKRERGYWIREKTINGWDGKSYQCSCCGRSIHIDTKAEDLTDYPYCHCGAKMEPEVVNVNDVFDEIKAEIKSLERFKMRGEITPLVNVDRVSQIIDKYKAESAGRV